MACRECPVLHIYDKFTHCDSGINSKQYCFLVLLCNQMFSKMYFVICALKRGSDGGGWIARSFFRQHAASIYGFACKGEI